MWYLFVCFTGSYFGPAESGHTSHPIRLRSTLLSHSRLHFLFIYFFFCSGVSIRFRFIALLYRASRSHSDTPHSVGFPGRVISLKQGPLPENTQHSQQRDMHAPSRIRTHKPRKWGTSDPHLRLWIHWERLPATIVSKIIYFLHALQ
jgi:hypothetical protein